MAKRKHGWMVVAMVAAMSAIAARSAPVVTNFSPDFGPPGTRVTVAGSGFAGAIKVQFNNTPADFEAEGNGLLVATVPVAATTGPIRVSDDGGTGDSGARHFLPAPRITSFDPVRGAVGTTVVLEGYNFSAESEVYFGEALAEATATTPQQLRAIVPDDWTNSVPIRVTTIAGSVISDAMFTLTGSDPIIDLFAPTYGAPGTEVRIVGANFEAVTGVRFGEVWASVVDAPTPSQINAVVPSMEEGSVSITVQNASGAVESLEQFEVTWRPVITAFAPKIGKSGTQVTIEGVNFTGVQNVWFGEQQVNSWGSPVPGQILTYVPEGAETAPITVRNAYGDGVTEEDFVVPIAPVIWDFDPAEGQPGVTSVYITGLNLSGGHLFFNETPAAYTVVGASPEAIRATVPLEATTGPLILTNSYGVFTSEQEFTVYGDAPLVQQIVPDHGPRGSTVTLEGLNFIDLQEVTFAGTTDPTAFAATPSRITATVPAEATTGEVVVKTSSGIATNAQPFYLPPRISSISPAEGAVGTSVTLQGANVGDATTVDFAGVLAEFSKQAADELTATVPTNAVSGLTRVSSPGGVVLSAEAFSVIPQITAFTPAQGPNGTSVTIQGTTLQNTRSVSFNGRSAWFEVVSSREVQTVVPAASTTGRIRVVTDEGTAESATDFVVTVSTDLALTGVISSSVLAPGETVTMAYAVVNQGLSMATSVRLVEVLPAGLTNVAAEASQGTWENTPEGVAFDVGVVASGQTVTFSTSATAEVDYEGQGQVEAEVSMAENDWDGNNNYVEHNLAVIKPSSLELRISSALGREAVVVQWPVSVIPLQLQRSPDLAQGTEWDSVTAAPEVIDDFNVLTNEVSGAAIYFRLQWSGP